MDTNISNIKKRITQFAEYKGFSKRKIYTDTSIANGVLTRSGGLTEDNIGRFISTYPEVNPSWLLTGKGEMLKEPSIQKPYSEGPQVPFPLKNIDEVNRNFKGLMKDDIFSVLVENVNKKNEDARITRLEEALKDLSISIRKKSPFASKEEEVQVNLKNATKILKEVSEKQSNMDLSQFIDIFNSSQSIQRD